MNAKPILCLLASAIAWSFALQGASAATFEVTRGDDPQPDGCLVSDCSLREALAAAQATPEADTVLLDAGQYFFTLGELQVVGEVTLEGAGMDQTQVIGPGGIGVLRVTGHSHLTAVRLSLVSDGDEALVIDDEGAATLREVKVPQDSGSVMAAGDAPGSGTATLRVEHSTIASAIVCFLSQSSCRVSDSVIGAVYVEGTEAALHLDRVEVVGPYIGILVQGGGAVTIQDSTIHDALLPLVLNQGDAVDAADVWISHTRFIGNGGPIGGNREATIHLDDVEFRDNIVDASNLTQPAVLLAQTGPSWRFDRALIVGNRGGGYGAAVTVEPGGAVGLFNSTIDDNTFHPDATIGAGYSHAIGIYGNGIASAFLFIAHSTLRRATALAPDAPGSLLAVRWDTADVIVANSLLRGTCAFGAGGSAGSGVGNIEAPGNSCLFDPAQNQSLPEIELRMGSLVDHGGFTHSYEPDPGSALLDAGNELICRAFDLDQRGYLRDPGGIDCDVGSVEVGAVDDSIFDDGFDA